MAEPGDSTNRYLALFYPSSSVTFQLLGIENEMSFFWYLVVFCKSADSSSVDKLQAYKLSEKMTKRQSLIIFILIFTAVNNGCG